MYSQARSAGFDISAYHLYVGDDNYLETRWVEIFRHDMTSLVPNRYGY